MRVGQNPAKSEKTIAKPRNITVCTITYIPFLSGFYEQSLDVLKESLNSLWSNTKVPFDLLVFDNNSCKEVKEYLLEEQANGRIQFLTLSDQNIGKGGAWNYIFNAVPGEIVAFSDSDIFYEEGWLKESINVMEIYPKVGMVTGRPIYSSPEYFTATIEWADSDKNAKLLKAPAQIPWEIFEQHTNSLGLSDEFARNEHETGDIYSIKYQNLNVVMGAGHFQFVSKRSLLKQTGPYNWDKPLGPDRELDVWFNDNGYLRLCLNKPLVRHMGNRLEKKSGFQSSTKGSLKKRILNNRIVRAVLLRTYNRIFKLYFED
ncbi:MAG: glycosyltransferase [Chloroflexi bacterium]|jgi:glycosyltransferase involved in cell wall biosynthesis|nr:glycosyltransferase [Chloroflexota bacterium]MBT3670054.1 glycosyltransferase [Chloroflexota bacterium]MBT4002205.1 glycosyltransferase [Chloroflexota bacterium]MBT4306744.1 glycosyltransferase [Chloroflexota bacterium]MBT4532940.1 glycosyltransferase [Chloroflexota bacterium]